MTRSSIAHKFSNSFYRQTWVYRWQRYHFWLRSRSGFLDRRFRFPNPLKLPYRRSQLHLGRGGALGDVLLCTPALRELKRINAPCDATFYTNFPGLLKGLPFIYAVRGYDELPGDCLSLEYEDLIPPRRHIAKILGDKLGLRIRDVRPSCAVNLEIVSRFLAEWRDMRRPRIIVNRRAGPWTPNKDWPDEYWGDLLDRLTARFSVIEIGASAQDRGVQPGDHYLDLRGKTGLEELVAAIGAADLHVGPISGPVHIAAALGTPAVVIYGGYEHPVCTAYPGNINLYSPVHCDRAGCARHAHIARIACIGSSRTPSKTLSIGSGARRLGAICAKRGGT